MSPEPSQEPVDQNLKADTNLSLHRTEHESDSEDENFEAAGYLPLSQVPTDVDTLLDDDDVGIIFVLTLEDYRSLRFPLFTQSLVYHTIFFRRMTSGFQHQWILNRCCQ